MAIPTPRLCHLTKYPHNPSYGFSLISNLTKPGLFISRVDMGSPAEDAGVKLGDRLVEVNGVNVGLENHKPVVARI